MYVRLFQTLEKVNQSVERTYLCSLWHFFIYFFIQFLPHCSLQTHWQIVGRLDRSLKGPKLQQNHTFISTAPKTKRLTPVGNKHWDSPLVKPMFHGSHPKLPGTPKQIAHCLAS